MTIINPDDFAGSSSAPRQRRRESPDIAILASRLLFAVQDEMFGRLAAEGHPDIRPRHGAVLAYIDREGTRATELSVRSGRHKQIIGNLVDELESLGYVERVPDPEDRRAKLIVPTARGIDQMQRSDAIMREIESRHSERVSAAEFVAFKRLLETIASDQERDICATE